MPVHSLRTAFFAIAHPGANTLGDLQLALKCGTECGSCLPELKRMCAMTKAAA